MKSKATKLLIGVLALVLCLLIVGIAVSGVLNPATVSGPAAMDVLQEETAGKKLQSQRKAHKLYMNA